MTIRSLAARCRRLLCDSLHVVYFVNIDSQLNFCQCRFAKQLVTGQWWKRLAYRLCLACHRKFQLCFLFYFRVGARRNEGRAYAKKHRSYETGTGQSLPRYHTHAGAIFQSLILMKYLLCPELQIHSTTVNF